MADLLSTLYSSANAMRAHSAALDIVGRNMANVNNPAYARQRVVYGDKGSVNTPLGVQSLGLEAVGIQQMRDTLLDGEVVTETSNTAVFDAQTNYLSQAQTALGQGVFGDPSTVETISSNSKLPAGIGASLDAFFNAWQSYATDPTATTAKQQLIGATDDVINKIHTADTRLADIALTPAATANTLTSQMDTKIGTVNGLLTTIAGLNRQIGQAEIINPGSAVDLRDQRQAKLEELAGYIDFKTVPQTSGQVGIQVKDNAVPANTVDLVNLATVQGTLSRNGANYQWTPTSGAASTLAVTGGELAGLQQVGNTVQGYRTQLDTLVSTLVARVNTAYNSAANGDFFTAAGTTGATIARTATTATVVAANAASGAAANDNALAVAAIAHDTTFLGGTPTQAFSKIVMNVAQGVSTNDNRLSDQKSLSDLLKSQRSSYGGVSLDEEAADMLRYQRAYQASAKILSVVDGLMQTVMDALR